MKHVKFLLIYMVAICVIFLPQGKAPMASSNGVPVAYQAYPKPSSKPLQCDVEFSAYENYDKKQAVVAALGLYLGVKQATAPNTRIKYTNLCVEV